MAEEIIRFETTHYDEKTESATLSCKTITRAEAIEKMAKAICKIDANYDNCSNCACKDNPKRCAEYTDELGCKELAEAALNALLGE